MNRGRAHVRHANHVRSAVEATLLEHFAGDRLGSEWFDEMMESSDEAAAAYEKYVIEQQLNRRAG